MFFSVKHMGETKGASQMKSQIEQSNAQIMESEMQAEYLRRKQSAKTDQRHSLSTTPQIVYAGQTPSRRTPKN